MRTKEGEVAELETVDVLIIGAGAAGMMCAIEAASVAARCWCSNMPRHRARRSAFPAAAAATSPTSMPSPKQLPLGQPAFLHLGAERATRRAISSPWSIATGSPGTKRRSASCSATARPTQIIAMLLAEMERRRRGAAAEHHGRARREDRCRLPVVTLRWRRWPAHRWSSPAAASRSRRWARPASAIEIAEQFGLRIVETRPALVPLTFDAGTAGAAEAAGRRRGRGSGWQLRQDSLRGSDAVHPSRPQRSGHPADLVLLARGRRDRAWTMLPPGRRARGAAGRAPANGNQAVQPRSPNTCRSGSPRSSPSRPGLPGNVGRPAPTRRCASCRRRGE